MEGKVHSPDLVEVENTFQGDMYALESLTGIVEESSFESKASGWINGLLTSSQKWKLSTLTQQSLPKLDHFVARCSTEVIQPDVTVLVTEESVPILTVEVVSDLSPEQSLDK